MSAVSFRAAWRWLVLWVCLDLVSYWLRDVLPAWLAVTDIERKLFQDFSIAFFILGLWIFERFDSTETHRTKPESKQNI